MLSINIWNRGVIEISSDVNVHYVMGVIEISSVHYVMGVIVCVVEYKMAAALSVGCFESTDFV